MRETEKIYYRKKASNILDVLRKRQYDPHFFETLAEASRFILDQIRPGETVGVGGSVTLRESLGIVEGLREHPLRQKNASLMQAPMMRTKTNRLK